VARRDRNRIAVLDAVIELFAEGRLDPGPDEVAERVGLSPRSVYRYFQDREALLRAAIDRQLEQVWPLYLIHAIGEGPLDDRIDRFVTSRLRLYDAISATSRAARLRGIKNEIVREQVELTRRALLEQVEKHFAPELGALDVPQRRATTAALDTLCQFESLDHYRINRRFSQKETRAMLVNSLTVLLEADERMHQR
jgi:AcrR family transcriptional regulator